MSTYVPIASQTLTSTATEIIFSSIPQNYTDLVLVCNVQVTTSTDDINIQFNGDTTSTKYSFNQWFSVGGSQYTSRTDNANKFRVADYMPNGTLYGTIVANIMSYTDQNKFKTTVSRWGNGATATGMDTGLWRSYEPITSIRLTEGSGLALKVGSSFSLYGIAGGNSSAKATGGNIVTTDGSYWYHAFTSSGIFIPSETLTADYVVVAGGAGGGYSQGGGGGAGGVLSSTGVSLSANTVYPALVGAGGAGSTSAQAYGRNGINSVFSSSTAIGGGGGGTGGVTGQNGGSGGGTGGNGPAGTFGTGTSGQGNNGGTGSTGAPFYGGGGGGGAGGAGTNGTSSVGGNGGAGLNTWSTWLSSTGLGVSGYIAGGGGGGTFTGGSYGTGGSGGGGRAGNYSSGEAGQPAVVNTGSGGGGSSYGPSFPGSAGPGGNGASGLIIIRYAV